MKCSKCSIHTYVVHIIDGQYVCHTCYYLIKTCQIFQIVKSHPEISYAALKRLLKQ